MIPIITYHAIGDGPRPLWVSVGDFEAHLDAYKKAGYQTISLASLVDSLGRDLPENALVITFDDGYESVYSLAWPRLRAAGLGGTVFLVTDYCEQTNKWPGQSADVPPAPLLGWKQVLEMANEGCEFGAHTRTHPHLMRATRQEVLEELVSSRDRIQSVTGRAADMFAYPYGETDRGTTDLVSQHFRGAVGTRLGVVKQGSSPFLLPRIDAYYLTPSLIRQMKNLSFRAYLEGRQYLRWFRGFLKAHTS
jgi:peptidoglycan/xylan/chitin deacetylase (PgdA/CDA1 family)